MHVAESQLLVAHLRPQIHTAPVKLAAHRFQVPQGAVEQDRFAALQAFGGKVRYGARQEIEAILDLNDVRRARWRGQQVLPGRAARECPLSLRAMLRSCLTRD
jgi:hypothetical protein